MNRKITTILAVAAVAAAGGCGGGNGDENSSTIAASLSGTAAAGRPLSGATVTVKDVAGHSAITTTDASGAFRFDDIAAFEGALIARVQGGVLGCTGRAGCTERSNTESYVGVSTSDDRDRTLNLTPMSHAIVGGAAGVDPGDLFIDPRDLPTPRELFDATVNVIEWLARLNPEDTVSASLDFLEGAFTTTPGDPQDTVLDLVGFVFETLALDLLQFGLLVLVPATGDDPPPVPVFCDVAGTYSGNYSGDREGTWSAELDAFSGAIATRVVASGVEIRGAGVAARTGLGEERASVAFSAGLFAGFEGTVSARRRMAGTWGDVAGGEGEFNGQHESTAQACR